MTARITGSADTNGLFTDFIELFKEVLSVFFILSTFCSLTLCPLITIQTGTAPLQVPAQHIMPGLPTRLKPALHLTRPEKKLGLARPDTCPFGTTGSLQESVKNSIIQ